ncbi:MAG: PD-(D/E)XK nuclease family protein, partial [Planctomycetota bacterium]
MAVRFILGRSGTGKTSYCVSAIINALLESGRSRPLIFLVPEQATYQAERAVLSDKRIAGYNRLQILSFDRLQFLLTGKNSARPAISRLGRQMIIHRILRENRNKLKLFRDSAHWTGLSRQMAEAISEFHNYAKDPDDIDLLLQHLQKDQKNTLTTMKFADIELVLKEYLAAVKDKFLDPDIQLNQTCSAIAQTEFAKQATLWVDGFAGFTTSELAILKELLMTAQQTHIALCLDTEQLDPNNPSTENIDPTKLFSPTEKTYAELFDIVKKCKLQIEPPVILKKTWRFGGTPDIEHIEKNIFKTEPARQKHHGSVNIVSAANPRAEITFTAGKILELVKENGWHYRDIAVIASDI